MFFFPCRPAVSVGVAHGDLSGVELGVLHGVKMSVFMGVMLGVVERDDRRDLDGDSEYFVIFWSLAL